MQTPGRTYIAAMEADIKDPPDVTHPEYSARARAYPATAKPPYAVFFRQIEKPLDTTTISNDLHKQYRSIQQIRKITLKKIRVVVTDRNDANAIVKNKLFQQYRVYIPSEEVEIDGVIEDSSLNVQDILENGVGKFRNPNAPSVNILDVVQLVSSRRDGENIVYDPSHSYRITFEGTALPDYLEINRALIPVRLYIPKVLMCTNCKRYGHSAKMCDNKARCGKCAELHDESACTFVSPLCIRCNAEHDPDPKSCPTYADHMSITRRKLLEKSRLSFAELLSSADEEAVALENAFSPLADLPDDDPEENGNCSYTYVFPKRKKRIAIAKRAPEKQPPQIQSPRNIPTTDRLTFNKAFSSKSNQNTLPQFHRLSQKEPQQNHSSSFNINDNKQFPSLPEFHQKQNHTRSEQSIFSIPQLIRMICSTFRVSNTWMSVVESMMPLFSLIWEKLIVHVPLLAFIAAYDA